MKNTNRKAFTIVELVIVIAIIAILVAVLIPTFVSIVNMAKVSNDTQLIRNLNTALAVDKASGNEHPTMQSALDAAEAAGYDIAKINNNAATENEILWDSKNDLFCYLTANGIDYIPESNMTDDKRPTDSTDYWRITDDATLANGGAYSVYLNGSAPEDGKVTTAVGFDAGTTTGITEVTYNGGTSSKTVVLRTNSYGTAITINAFVAADGKGDTVEHYGICGTLTTVSLATQSYHEYGNIAVANIGAGRVVAESKGNYTGNIELAYVTNGAVIVQENGGTIKVAYASAADVKADAEPNGNVELVYDTTKTEAENRKLVEQAKNEVLSKAQEQEVVAANKDYVARIGVNGYTDLQTAVSGAKDGDTIQLVNNVTLTKALLIGDSTNKNARNLTLDLNGKTITTKKGTNGLTINDNVIITDTNTEKEGEIISQATSAYAGISVWGLLTIEDGIFKNANSASTAASIVKVQENAEVIINGGSIKAGQIAKNKGMINCTATNAKLTVNGGRIENTYLPSSYSNGQENTTLSTFGIAVYNSKNLIINGGEIVSKTIGIYSTTGNTEITGGTIDADNPLVVNSGTTTVKGGTFEGASEAVYVNGTATVTIKGGFFTSDIPNYTVNKIDSVIDSATITITGGTYVNFNPSDNTADGEGTNYVSEGYTVTSEVKEDGTYYTVNS